jgi:hypothetical protein
MSSPLFIVNLALGKLGGARIPSLAPPTNEIASFFNYSYKHWKRLELEKNTWQFSLERITLVRTAEAIPDVEKPYQYQKPNDSIRPVREADSEWESRGDYIYSAKDSLKVLFVTEAPENDYPPCFVEVLACKIAFESCETINQSNKKKELFYGEYENALMSALSLDAYLVGSQPFADDSAGSRGSWLSSRQGWYSA